MEEKWIKQWNWLQSFAWADILYWLNAPIDESFLSRHIISRKSKKLLKFDLLFVDSLDFRYQICFLSIKKLLEDGRILTFWKVGCVIPRSESLKNTDEDSQLITFYFGLNTQAMIRKTKSQDDFFVKIKSKNDDHT